MEFSRRWAGLEGIILNLMRRASAFGWESELRMQQFCLDKKMRCEKRMRFCIVEVVTEIPPLGLPWDLVTCERLFVSRATACQTSLVDC